LIHSKYANIHFKFANLKVVTPGEYLSHWDAVHQSSLALIVVSDELNTSARLSCGLALTAYLRTAEVLGLESPDLSSCLEPVHKVTPFGGYIQGKDNPQDLITAIRKEQLQFLPGDYRTDREKLEEAEALKRAGQGTRTLKRKARPQPQLASLIDEWREPVACRSAASSRAPSRAGSPARGSWADVANKGQEQVTSPGVPGIADWVSTVDLEGSEVDRFLDDSEKMLTGTEDMDESFHDAHDNM
jgi:hypothetical protein